MKYISRYLFNMIVFLSLVFTLVLLAGIFIGREAYGQCSPNFYSTCLTESTADYRSDRDTCLGYYYGDRAYCYEPDETRHERMVCRKEARQERTACVAVSREYKTEDIAWCLQWCQEHCVEECL